MLGMSSLCASTTQGAWVWQERLMTNNTRVSDRPFSRGYMAMKHLALELTFLPAKAVSVSLMLQYSELTSRRHIIEREVGPEMRKGSSLS
jgi:hypothetical protein